MRSVSELTERRHADWEELASLVERAGSCARVRRLSRTELRRLGPLYRRTASDLALLRLRGGEAELIAYLNDIVTRAHGLLYAAPRSGAKALWHFYAHEVPAVIRQYRWFVFAAAAMLFFGGAVGAAVVGHDPSQLRTVVPAMFADNDEYYEKRANDPSFDPTQSGSDVFAARLMTHNTGVAVLSFAVGILGGFPTLIILFVNGSPLGGLAMQQHLAGRDVLFWSLILPHGVVELTATCLDSAAGMILGWAIVAPGNRRRRDALLIAGRDAVRILLGTVPLYIIAGLTESYITPSLLIIPVKFAYAALTAALLILYVRRRH